jgi:hypothetical protein
MKFDLQWTHQFCFFVTKFLLSFEKEARCNSVTAVSGGHRGLLHSDLKVTSRKFPPYTSETYHLLNWRKKMRQLVCLLMLVEAHFWDHEKDMPIVQLTKCAPLNLYLFVHLDTAEKTLHCHLVSQWKTSRVYQGRYSGRRYHVDN